VVGRSARRQRAPDPTEAHRPRSAHRHLV